MNAYLTYQSFFFGIPFEKTLRQLSHPPSSISRLFFAWLLLAILLVGSQTAFSACDIPKITGFSPHSGVANTFINVFGSGFGMAKNRITKISINGIPATFVEIINDSSLFFVLPSGNTVGSIQVTNSRGTANSSESFGIPTTGLIVNGVWPNLWPDPASKNVVWVFGSGFVSGTDAGGNLYTQVKVGNTPVYAQVYNSNLLFFLPPPPGIAGVVTVTVSGSTVAAPVNFTVTPPMLPLPISLLHTTVDYANSMVTIKGEEGAVEPHMMVEITNTTKNSPPSIVRADSVGCFEPAQLSAGSDDELSLLVKHPDGNYSTVRRTEPEPAPVPATTKVTVLEDPLSPGPYTPIIATGYASTNESSWIYIVYPECPSSGNPLEFPRCVYPSGTATTGVIPTDMPVVLFQHGETSTSTEQSGSHLGYEYLMKALASHGFFAISINAYTAKKPSGETMIPSGQSWEWLIRDRLHWLQDLNNGKSGNGISSDFGGKFMGKLRNINGKLQVGLIGHSRGGYETFTALKNLGNSGIEPIPPATVIALAGIAPNTLGASISLNLPYSVPYFLMLGGRDGYCGYPMPCFDHYDYAYPENERPSPLSKAYKMVSYIYGANHNYFNTAWTTEEDSQKLLANIFPQFPENMLADTQRNVAISTLTAFLRWHIDNVVGYREFFSDRNHFSSLPNKSIYWTMQGNERFAVDDFENIPAGASSSLPKNGPNKLLGGQYTSSFNSGSLQCKPLGGCSVLLSGYVNGWNLIRHPTGGIKLEWNGQATYRTEIPSGSVERQVESRGYKYLTLRAARVVAQVPAVDDKFLNLRIRLVDGLGQDSYEVTSNRYGILPTPNTGSYTHLTGIRIPLEDFTINKPGFNPNDIAAIEIRPGLENPTGIMILDDIEFSK